MPDSFGPPLALLGSSSPERSRSSLGPPSAPPASKSVQNIVQLTGFDPKFNRNLLELRHSVSSEYSDSSGSHYSQPECGIEESEVVSTNHRGSPLSAPTHRGRAAVALQWPTCSPSDKSAGPSEMSVNAQTYTSTLPIRQRAVRDDYRKENLIKIDSNEQCTLKEFIDQETLSSGGGFEHHHGGHYNHEIIEAHVEEMVPQSPAIRGKVQKSKRCVMENPPLFSSVREPRTRGRHDITASINKHNATVSPTAMSHDEMPLNILMQPPPKPARKRNFSNGKNALKSQFSFNSNDSDSLEPGSKFRKRISGAMKRFSGARESIPVKQTIISNAARNPDGPDTPIPGKSRMMSMLPSWQAIQNGNEHLQEVVDKARKTMRIRSTGERKRESLKKTIVVVGVTDQSPDGTVTEWL